DGLADRGGPRPLPGARRVRVGGPRPLRGVARRRAHRARRHPRRRLPPGRRGGREVLPHPRPVDSGGPLMPEFPRAELEEMVERWLQANRDAEAAGDWRPMAELYAPDATYGWNYGPEHDFMVVGRDQIREVALGLEM